MKMPTSITLEKVKMTTEPFELPQPPEGVDLGGPIEIVTGAIEPFTDRWCCLMCRTANDICEFHQSMEADGYKPPLSFSRLL